MDLKDGKMSAEDSVGGEDVAEEADSPGDSSGGLNDDVPRRMLLYGYSLCQVVVIVCIRIDIKGTSMNLTEERK